MTSNLPSTAFQETAERLLLGCLLHDPTMIMTIDLDTDDFTSIERQRIWCSMVKLSDAGRAVTEQVIEYDNDHNANVTAEICLIHPGGKDNVDMWIERVHEARRIRDLAIAIDDLKLKTLAHVDTADDLSDAIVERVEKLKHRRKRTEHVSGEELLAGALKAWKKRQWQRMEGETAIRGIPIGVAKFDDLTGGLPIGNTSIIAARPGGGKTTLIFNALITAARSGCPALYLSNEDKSGPLGTSALAYESGVNRRLIASGEVQQLEQSFVMNAPTTAAPWAQNFLAVYVHGWKMQKIVRVARALIRRHKIKIAALDYIQRVPDPERGLKRNYAVEQNVEMWDLLAAQESIAAPLGCQIRRGEGVPTKDDLKDSGSLEQIAKMIVGIHSTDYKKENDLCDLIVMKHNEGVELTLSDIGFRRSRSRFY